MSISNLAVDGMTYEQAFTELDEILQALEGGESSLEDTQALYERGVALAQRCQNLLDQAELRVQQLNGFEGLDGESEEG